MSLRFCALASGSRGNALLVEHEDTLIMIDCGLPLKRLAERLAHVDRSPDDIDALLVTHEHGDHSRGIGPLTRRHDVPVWATAGTAHAVDSIEAYQKLRPSRELVIGSMRLQSYPVPHDAREPCQFVFEASGRRLGLLTDSGHTTPAIHAALESCDALAVEFNHDRGMLESGSYPEAVKARVGSRYGHLNNEQAADLIGSVARPNLQWVAALHLSEQNNCPDKVRAAAAGALDHSSVELRLAAQDEPTGWIEID